MTEEAQEHSREGGGDGNVHCVWVSSLWRDDELAGEDGTYDGGDGDVGGAAFFLHLECPWADFSAISLVVVGFFNGMMIVF